MLKKASRINFYGVDVVSFRKTIITNLKDNQYKISVKKNEIQVQASIIGFSLKSNGGSSIISIKEGDGVLQVEVVTVNYFILSLILFSNLIFTAITYSDFPLSGFIFFNGFLFFIYYVHLSLQSDTVKEILLNAFPGDRVDGQ